jgi:Ca-activated chloride channel homolog
MVRAHLVVTGGLIALMGLLVGCSASSAPQAGARATASKPADDLGASRYPTSPAPAASAVPAAAEAAPSAALAARQEPRPPESAPAEARIDEGRGPGEGGDKYASIVENEFLATRDTPLSTFSIDVDTASYSKTRSYLLDHHQLPPADAVRIEELVNYFDYDYAGPTDEHPFAVHLETAECPWQPQHRLVRVGIQGKRLVGERPVSNLVFLIDVSGSMNQPNKLPLVQRSLAMLVRQLGENDRVAIVVYAGAAGLVLPPTSGTEQSTILAAIENLQAGGSTNGGQGIHLAYAAAKQNFIKHGTNRVLLCTDGDFNVGVTSTGELVRLATEQAKGGIYLSILGFGFGNHNDAMLEELSNKANGNYAFIDSDSEARKVLVEQMQGTLVTIAKDVKLQVEFNPATVAAYRLIGYENRRLADRDFNDDTKDAGDIGAGHSVTGLYELVPAGLESPLAKAGVDPLKYQATGDQRSEVRDQNGIGLTEAAKTGELLTLKLRYQLPAGGPSTLLTFPLKDSGSRFTSASGDMQFATAVASFGMLLRNSKFKGNASYAAVLEMASAARGEDKHGLRAEFLTLVQAAQRLNGEPVGMTPHWLPGRCDWRAARRAAAGGLGRSCRAAAGVAAHGPVAELVVEPADRAGVLARDCRGRGRGDWGARGGSEGGAVASAAGKRACTVLQNSRG